MQVEYLLCYGAVGFGFQLFYLQRGVAAVQALSELLDTQRTLDKIYVIHAALLTWRILSLQVPLLPDSARRLERQVTRPDGSTILLADDYVVKTVPQQVFHALGVELARLQGLYTAVQGNEYVVHAVKGPTLGSHNYEVYLEPLGQPLSPTAMAFTPVAAASLKKAIRCASRDF